MKAALYQRASNKFGPYLVMRIRPEPKPQAAALSVMAYAVMYRVKGSKKWHGDPTCFTDIAAAQQHAAREFKGKNTRIHRVELRPDGAFIDLGIVEDSAQAPAEPLLAPAEPPRRRKAAAAPVPTKGQS